MGGIASMASPGTIRSLAQVENRPPSIFLMPTRSSASCARGADRVGAAHLLAVDVRPQGQVLALDEVERVAVCLRPAPASGRSESRVSRLMPVTVSGWKVAISGT